MTLEEALKTAIAYETEIRDIYAAGAHSVDDHTARQMLETLAADEQHHLDYLQDQLQRWRSSGQITPTKMESVVPSAKVIQREVAKLKHKMGEKDHGVHQQLLSKALAVERKTSRFYQEMVEQMEDAARELFAHFLEIENNHIEAVQFELDYVTQTGHWFDFKEFDME
jgi:rubrerythrin